MSSWFIGIILTHIYYCNLPKIGPPLKITTPPSFFDGSCYKGCLTLKSTCTHLCCSTCGFVKQEVLKNQRVRDKQMRQAPFAFYCISKHLTEEVLQSRCRHLTACEVGVFSWEISQNMPNEPLKFDAHGAFSRDYCSWNPPRTWPSCVTLVCVGYDRMIIIMSLWN